MAPRDTAPPPNPENPQAASGRPVGVGATTYGAAALRLLDNGYAPLPIRPGTKIPPLKRWTGVVIDERTVARWSRLFPNHGIGLRTGALVGVDIDLLDLDLAYQIGHLARARLGVTLMRVGLWPKRLLLYRTEQPFPKLSVPGVEILGDGQQFVAFGIHPATGQPYDWPLGETPLDVPFDALPIVSAAACAELLAEASALIPAAGNDGARIRRSAPAASARPVRDAEGRVVDNRDAWLSRIAFHAVHDAIARDEPLNAGVLTARVWERFGATTELGRPRKDGDTFYGPADAESKVADKLRLHRDGRLPSRDLPPVEARYEAPTDSVEGARDQLDQMLAVACDDIAAWLADPAGVAPRIGIRATVGLGKSQLARRNLLALRERLIASGAPSRIVVFAPSHVLAEEAAEGWRGHGVTVAVLRGYEARDPATGEPMCQDIEAVRAAVTAALDVHSTACVGSGRRCGFFDSCLKQRNRVEVEAADVVVAPYDALYSGFAVEPASIGALMIDEGFWSRAVRETKGAWDAALPGELMRGVRGGRAADRAAGAVADLLDLRCRASAAFADNGPGPVKRASILRAGLTQKDCHDAARLEERAIVDPELYPGMPASERRKAMVQAEASERARFRVAVWRALAALLGEYAESNGRLRILRRDAATGAMEVSVLGVKAPHPNFRGKPILHLDATLRPELARAILPGLTITEIEALAPNMTVRLITGSFGKGNLCQESHADADENRRRANRVAECVDYVRWHGRRVAPGRVLVVTYLDCEAAFADIPGVEVAHFNAIAGLDAYRDVALLVVVGRPLPRDSDIEPMCGAYFGHVPVGGYRQVHRGVRMRDGTSRAVRVREHEDEQAEVLRAAICDDEVIQAIGRGRGVNRTEADPLEVHVLADVALPLPHDRVLAWEIEVPDILQRMLLAGVAIDSPADAAALHPALFGGADQAKKAFERTGFKGQNPIRNIYREMSLKHAAYRRPGQGRSWQNAYWIDGTAEATCAVLSRALGPLAEWKPSGS